MKEGRPRCAWYDRRLTDLGPPEGIEERRSGQDRRQADRRIAERRLFLVKTVLASPAGTDR